MRWLVAVWFSLCLTTHALSQAQPYVFEADAIGILDPMDVGFDAEGRVLVAAGREGLLRLEPDGSRTTIAAGRCERVPGRSVSAEPAARRIIERIRDTLGATAHRVLRCTPGRRPTSGAVK